MFKKYYKAANDDIKPNRELIDKIFEKAEKEASAPKRVYRFRPGYGTAVAAVLVLAISAVVYPQLGRMNETPVVVKNTNQIQAENTEIKPAIDTQKQATEDAKTEFSSRNTKTGSGTETSLNISETADMAAKTESEPIESPPQPSARMIEASQNDICEFLLTDISEASSQEIEAAQKVLFESFGEADADTGNSYIFEISGKAESGGKSYYVGRWRWLADDHSSLITEFVLSEDMTEMYECQYTEGGAVQWNISNNLLQYKKNLQH